MDIFKLCHRGKGVITMKKKTLAVVLSAVLAMGSAGTVFADTQSDLQAVEGKIASTEAQIVRLENELKQYDLDIAIIRGEIISTSPYFVVRGKNFGIDMISGNFRYYIVQTPESGVSGFGIFTGGYQVVGTQWIEVQGNWVEAIVLTDYPPCLLYTSPSPRD